MPEEWIFCAAMALVAIAPQAAAKPAPSAPAIADFPSPSIWQNEPTDWSAGDHALTLTAGKQTDWFVYPGGGYAKDSSPRWLFKPAGDFMFSAKVDIRAHATYDAGCLALYASPSAWAKFCLEAQADHRLAMVSVVTRGISDDATAFAVDGTSTYLRIAKAGEAIFFYTSVDGQAWTIVRKFHLQADAGWLAGFSAQSPEGDGMSAKFTEFRYLAKTVNLWDVQ